MKSQVVYKRLWKIANSFAGHCLYSFSKITQNDFSLHFPAPHLLFQPPYEMNNLSNTFFTKTNPNDITPENKRKYTKGK